MNIHLEESHISKLPYLQATGKETFRLHPPTPLLPRKSDVDVEISGFMEPKSAQIMVNVWAMGEIQVFGKTQISLYQKDSWTMRLILKANI